MVSDKHLNCLKPFCYLWQKHWAQRHVYHHPVTIYGYTEPTFQIPSNFGFRSLGDFKDYPVNRWSNGFLKALDYIEDDIVLLLLEDYFMLRDVDVQGVLVFEKYMLEHPEVFRFDLTLDRAQTAGIQPYGSYKHYDLVISNTTLPYNFSTQAGLFRKDMLKQLVLPNESAGEMEMYANGRLQHHPEWQVLGSKQQPMRYLIGVQQGQVTLNGGYQGESYALVGEDRAELEKLGYLRGL